MFVNKHFIYLGHANSESKCCHHAEPSAYLCMSIVRLRNDFFWQNFIFFFIGNMKHDCAQCEIEERQ